MDGEAWLVMELVEGRSLRDIVQRGPLPVRRTVEIARDLLEGLAGLALHPSRRPPRRHRGLIRILMITARRATRRRGRSDAGIADASAERRPPVHWCVSLDGLLGSTIRWQGDFMAHIATSSPRLGSPRWLLVLVAVLVGAGCAQDPQAALPEAYRALPVPVERLASMEARRAGRELYLSYCAVCHGWNGDGQGQRGVVGPVQDFTRPDWREGMTPRQAFYVVREGRQGTAMASFSMVSDEQTWDLVAYVLSIAEQGARVEGVDDPGGGG